MSETPVRAPIRILHLEDSRVDHALVKFALQRSQLPCELTLVDTLDDFQREIASGTHDIVLADYHLPGFSGLDAWERLRASGVSLPFVILSGAIGEAAAVDAMHRGVDDYLLKDNMQRLAELAEHLQTSIEQERADIAREIHDDIGGSLAAVKLDLAWIGRRPALDADMRQHIDTALDMLQHALGASQRIMMNLRPPILDQGMVAAVQWLASSFEKRTGMRVTVRRSAEFIDVPRELQLVAYRTAQEALTNVHKHANATSVDIDLSDREGVLTLEVSDNGQGMSPDALRKAKSFGLLGLKERAAKVDGWMDISSSPRGTSVILSVPLTVGSNGANQQGTDNDDQSDFV